MNINGLRKPFRKKSDPKNRKKTVKIKVKLPHVNKKPLARKQIIVQTPFSHDFKIRTKNIADRLPENSRNSFVNLQSKKNSKHARQIAGK